METEDSKLIVRTGRPNESLVLAGAVDAVLHQPGLELVWYRQGDQLYVIDLRNIEDAPALIARGMPEVGRLSVRHSAENATTHDGCDLPYVALSWTEQPAIEAFLKDAPSLRVTNAEWLRAQLARTIRTAPSVFLFGAPRVHLPRKLMQCDERSFCGMTAPFGARGLELVRVLDEMGGDCWERACLLHDPRTKQFATPLIASVWGTPESARPGPCGVFLFDAANSSFLIENKLCTGEEPCAELEGAAVGWLVPGPMVGQPGTISEE